MPTSKTLTNNVYGPNDLTFSSISDTTRFHLYTDAIVTGSGLSSYITAYYLAKADEQVVLIDEDKIDQAPPDTPTLITNFTDMYLQDMVAKFGEEKTRHLWNASQKSLTEIDRICARENIDCDFERTSAYLFAMDFNDLERLRNEYETAKELGLTNFKFRTIHKIGLGELAYLEVENQAKINIEKFTKGLKEACRKLGVLILSKDIVMEIDEEDNTDKLTVTTEHGKIEARRLITTSYEDPMDFDNKFANAKTYTIEAIVPSNTLPEVIFCSPSEPYHNFRIEKKSDGDHIIMSLKSKNNKLDDDEYFRDLEARLHSILSNQNYQIIYRWTNDINITNDGLPFIGQSPFYDNELISTGFGNNEVMYSMIAASVNRDIILGTSTNQLIDILDPERSSSPIDSLNRILNDTFQSIRMRFFGKKNNEIIISEERNDANIKQSILKYKDLNFKKDNLQKNLKHL